MKGFEKTEQNKVKKRKKQQQELKLMDGKMTGKTKETQRARHRCV